MRFFFGRGVECISDGKPLKVTKSRQGSGGEAGGEQVQRRLFMMEIKRTIKYDADRVKGFGREVMSVPGCEQWRSRIQCG